MRKLLLLFAIFLIGCGNKQELRRVCTCEQMEKVNSFVKESIKNANNMSDEEMEDVIAELYKVGVYTNCTQRMFTTTYDGYIIWEQNKLDSCETMPFIH